MFYKFDFTYRQYRRRRYVKCGIWALILLGIAMICLVSYRLYILAREPTLEQRLRAFNPTARKLQRALQDWTEARTRFQEIEPFWLLDTANEQPSALLAMAMTNQPAWSRWLAPKKLSMRANGPAELHFQLWFQGAGNKADALVDARASLEQGLAGWLPVVTFEEEKQLADRESIAVKVVCTPPPHPWPNGMAAPPRRLIEMGAAISNQHAEIWKYAPLKGYPKAITLQAALDKALIQAMEHLGAEKGRVAMTQWKACRDGTLSPNEVFDRVRQDLSKNGVGAEIFALTHCEAAWRHLAGRWWHRPRSLDTQQLRELETQCRGIYALEQPPPPTETFVGFADWMHQYKAAFTNVVTIEDIRMNGVDRKVLEDIYSRVLQGANKSRIASKERSRSSPGAWIGYADWTMHPACLEVSKGGSGLSNLYKLAVSLDRAERGIRLAGVEIVFDDKRRPAEAWSIPPNSVVFTGLIPWQTSKADEVKGGTP